MASYTTKDFVVINAMFTKYNRMKMIEQQTRDQIQMCKSDIYDLNCALDILNRLSDCESCNGDEYTKRRDIIYSSIYKDHKVLASLKQYMKSVSECCLELKREIKSYQTTRSNSGGIEWFTF